MENLLNRRTKALRITLIVTIPLMLLACDAMKFVEVSVERKEVCFLSVVKGKNTTIENELLVKGFKFSVVMNRSLSDNPIQLQVKCESGFYSAQTFKLGEIAGRRVIFEENGAVRVTD